MNISFLLIRGSYFGCASTAARGEKEKERERGGEGESERKRKSKKFVPKSDIFIGNGRIFRLSQSKILKCQMSHFKNAIFKYHCFEFTSICR